MSKRKKKTFIRLKKDYLALKAVKSVNNQDFKTNVKYFLSLVVTVKP